MSKKISNLIKYDQKTRDELVLSFNENYLYNKIYDELKVGNKVLFKYFTNNIEIKDKCVVYKIQTRYIFLKNKHDSIFKLPKHLDYIQITPLSKKEKIN